MRSLFVIVAVIAIVAASAAYFVSLPKKDFHEHANFAVYLNGERYNFSQEKYMTTEENEVGLRALVHMHDMDSGIVHIHKEGVTLGTFFESIGIKLDSTCFVFDDGTAYCNSPDKKLKIYVNGVQSYSYDKLGLHDLDKILVTFGNDSPQAIERQIDSVPINACIYSEKCEAPAGFVNNESLSCKSGETSCSA